MRCVRACIAGALLTAVCAPPAAAQQGLYAPFPKPATERRAKSYVERLSAGGLQLTVTKRQLERGVFLDGTGSSRQGARLSALSGPGVATARSGSHSSVPGAGSWVLAMIAAAGAFALAGRLGARLA
jgi:hypothetical protein